MFRRTLGRPRRIAASGPRRLPLARTVSDTLALDEDDRGLHFVAQLDPDDPDVKGVIGKIRRGDLSEMSFAFRASQNGQEWSDDGSLRQISNLSIHRGDISLVGYGANPSTSVTVRAEALTASSASDGSSMSGSASGAAFPCVRLVALPGLQAALSASSRKGRRCCAHQPPRRALVLARSVEIRRRARALERRAAKYDQHQIDQLGAKGEAFKHDDGSAGFPVADREDLENAIKAVGRKNADDRPAIRRWIRQRAVTMRLLTLIPASWSRHGTVSGRRGVVRV